MTDSEGKTLVRFDLWVVLAFLVLLSGIGMGYLFNAQAESRESRQRADQVLSERVTKVEAQIGYITEGITELKQGQLEVVKALRARKVD